MQGQPLGRREEIKPRPRSVDTLTIDKEGDDLIPRLSARNGCGLTCSHYTRPKEHSVRMQSIVQRVGNRVLGMRGRSFQVGRTGVSELSSTSGSECATRVNEVTAADKESCREWREEVELT